MNLDDRAVRSVCLLEEDVKCAAATGLARE
jgi:hypothetical protein